MTQDLVSLFQQGYRYAYSLTHDSAAADDILQDAWLAMLKIDAPTIQPYLFKTIRNQFINKYKREKIIPLTIIDNDLSETQLADSNADFSHLIANQDMLNKALAQLRAIEREIIFLYYIEEYSTSEVASLTDLSKGQVCSLIHRSREKLKRILESEAPRIAK